VHRVLVVDATPAQQRQRASQRDGRDTAQIDAVMQSQVDRDTRLAAADDVIHNDADLTTLKTQVATLHQKYRQLARPA
jgi:dephospho-CoA kinase